MYTLYLLKTHLNMVLLSEIARGKPCIAFKFTAEITAVRKTANFNNFTDARRCF